MEEITVDIIKNEDIKRGLAELGIDCDAEIGRRERGYGINGGNGKFCVEYAAKTDFFRAATILESIKDTEESVDISAENRFDTCGIMIDVSRNAVLKIETVKDVIRYMARMGLNMLMLYTEDTYKMEDYPYFGYMRGAYTPDEIHEIVDYAEIFGIECVPCIQTLAHLAKALRWNFADNMKGVCDTNDILMIDEEKTYAFIESMIKTVRGCFKTEKIHIGMDEAHFVGLGEYLNKHGYTDRFELLSRHLGRVCEIVKKYGFEPMMWSDMFFRLCSENGGYEADGKLPDNVSALIPESVSMVYWDYYNIDKEKYNLMIKAHKLMNRKIVFAGGIWTWAGVALNYDKTFATTTPALSACLENDVKDVFATMWGDDGAECSIYEALLGMQLFAEYNYSEKPEEELDKMFKICTGFDADAFRLFGIDTFDAELCPNHDAVVSKQVLYQDLLQGLFDRNFSALDLKTHYAEYAERLAALPNMGNLEYLFEYHRTLVGVLYKKCDLGIRITNAYKENDKKALDELCGETDELLTQVKKLHGAAADMWYKNNKPFGFELLDFRFGGMETRIGRAKERITDYLNGKIESVPELEEERLWFGEEGNPFIHNYFFGRIFD